MGRMSPKKRSSERHDKVGKVMHEYAEGTLRSSSGQLVTDRAQAVAIAISEAHRSKKRRKS